MKYRAIKQRVKDADKEAEELKGVASDDLDEFIMSQTFTGKELIFVRNKLYDWRDGREVSIHYILDSILTERESK